ncbi:MAG: Gfo/Idh/MocA family oxidoreductase [Treponemataceae bacterium]|nr:Gfo/Idh/MocA family oxidoreductase [Treponemataceae bacterium]
MGSKYASMIQDGKIHGLKLAAVTRTKPQFQQLLAPSLDAGLPVFETADALFEAVENGGLKLNAVIIATPHYSHEKIAVRAFKNGLHVLCEKPSGVYSRQARNMEKAADDAGKVFSMVFHFRTMPIYKDLKKLVACGKYGKLKKMRWLITDWYRPEGYYKTSSWHSSWKTDGGGVILNQCPHNLDLLQWICGMPSRVQGFCHEGKYHDIEMEDDVTVYMEWADGATGTFVSSTGDAPGVNRLELFMDEALIICENGKLRIGELQQEMGKTEAEYRRTCREFFKPIKGTWHEITPPEEKSPYEKLLQGFADECEDTAPGKSSTSGGFSGGFAAPDGREGRKSLLISNAIYLSSWKKKMIELPEIGSEEELQFEKAFESELNKRCAET